MTDLGIIAAAKAKQATFPGDLELLERCVEICRTYRLESVVLTNIRKLLEEHFEPSPDLRLFGMALLHHVANPNDTALRDCAEWVFWGLLKRKTTPSP